METPDPLPCWLTEEDVDFFATKFSKTGFTGGLNYYRALNLSWNGSKIEVAVKFIVGDLDLVYHFPGAKQYIHEGEFKKDVPFLEEVVVKKDAAHSINQEKPPSNQLSHLSLHQQHIHGNSFKEDVPPLEEVVVIEGAAHFINQEKADEIFPHL